MKMYMKEVKKYSFKLGDLVEWNDLLCEVVGFSDTGYYLLEDKKVFNHFEGHHSRMIKV